MLGGSDTAIDVARSVLRLGGKPIIIHRREEKYSRARADEIAEAENEGVEFRFATNLVKLEGENGKLRRAVIAKTHQKRPGAAPILLTVPNRLSIPTWSSWRRGINLNRDLRRYLSCQSVNRVKPGFSLTGTGWHRGFFPKRIMRGALPGRENIACWFRYCRSGTGCGWQGMP